MPGAQILHNVEFVTLTLKLAIPIHYVCLESL